MNKFKYFINIVTKTIRYCLYICLILLLGFCTYVSLDYRYDLSKEDRFETFIGRNYKILNDSFLAEWDSEKYPFITPPHPQLEFTVKDYEKNPNFSQNGIKIIGILKKGEIIRIEKINLIHHPMSGSFLEILAKVNGYTQYVDVSFFFNNRYQALSNEKKLKIDPHYINEVMDE